MTDLGIVNDATAVAEESWYVRTVGWHATCVMFLGVVKLLAACADGGVRGVAHKRTVRFRKKTGESKRKQRESKKGRRKETETTRKAGKRQQAKQARAESPKVEFPPAEEVAHQRMSGLKAWPFSLLLHLLHCCCTACLSGSVSWRGCSTLPRVICMMLLCLLDAPAQLQHSVIIVIIIPNVLLCDR